jgi:PIN domain nuclease of toxin-antitoxin system
MPLYRMTSWPCSKVRILLDTHCWLWWLISPERLSASALGSFRSREHELFLSAASAWEIAIKYSSGRLRLPLEPGEFVRSRLAASETIPLAVHHNHALQVAHLPRHHADPFDRLLIAQAQVEGLAVMTADPSFRAYDVEVIGT